MNMFFPLGMVGYDEKRKEPWTGKRGSSSTAQVQTVLDLSSILHLIQLSHL